MSNKPEKGKLLIAEPFMPDENFKRTVILLCAHNKKEGSFGFVINKEISHKLKDAIPELEALDAKLYYGGPVEPNTLHYVHSYGDLLPNSVKLGEDLYWGGDFDVLYSLINTKQIDSNKIKFFIGYSGWDSGQLEDEMSTNSWIVANCLPEYIFMDQPDTVWRKVLSDMGGEYKVMSNYPENPMLN